MSGFKNFLIGGRPNYRPDPNDSSLAHGADIYGQAQNYLGQVDNRGGPQAQESTYFRGAQAGLVGQLQGVASGQQQGAGELAAQHAIQRAIAQQQGMAMTARGGNAALMQREAARNQASLGIQGAGQAQIARMQDQTQAQGLLGQVAAQARSGDQNIALANLNAQLQARGMDDQQRIALLGQLYGVDAAEMQARMQQAQAQAAAGKSAGYLGDLLQTGGNLGAAYITNRGRPAAPGTAAPAAA